MYEVCCPFCGGSVETPFVRVGAVSTCPHCRRRYKVSEPMIRRVATVAEAGLAEAGPEVAPPVPAAAAVDAGDAPQWPESARRSPEARRAAAAEAEPALDLFRDAVPAPRRSGRILARELARRRNRLSALWLALAMTGIILSLAAVVLVGLKYGDRLASWLSDQAVGAGNPPPPTSNR